MMLVTSCIMSIGHEHELGETSATIVLCICFMNYMYFVLTLLGEDGGHVVDTGDISLLEH